MFAGERDGQRYFNHDGAAVSFLTQNTVYPDQGAAVTVIVNDDFSNAAPTIGDGIARIVLPAPDESAITAKARAMFDSLAAGAPDAARLTGNARYYFTPARLGDYRASLATLGRPTSFEPARAPRLRGGFVNRNYLVTYAESGPNGRYERFLVQPAS